MAATDSEVFIGTAHLFVGAFSADGAALKALGEQAAVTVNTGDGQVAYARTPSGLRSAKNAIDYGRVPTVDVELDEVARDVVGTLFSGAIIDANGNVGFSTGARKLDTVSVVVVPSSNIDDAGAVINPQNVFWIPFMAGAGGAAFTFNNQTGENANTPVSTQLVGLTDTDYAGAPIPEILQSLYWGDMGDQPTGWKLPVPYQAAGA